MARDIIWDHAEAILERRETVRVQEKQILDRLVPVLQTSGNHKGVIIGGCNPWHVSVSR